jgi:hypothetical protein
MIEQAREAVGRYTWEQVRPEWLDVYGATRDGKDIAQQSLNERSNPDETPAAV